MLTSRFAPILLVSLAVLAGCATAPGVYAPQALEAREGFESLAKKKPLPAGAISENFTKVNANLYRGGLPDDAAFAKIAQMGVKTDISFMSDKTAQEKPVVAHEKELVTGLGMTFVNMPTPFDEAPSKAYVEKFLSIVNDPAAQPVYVHCFHGRDRTGTMVATYRMTHDGLTPTQALDEMKTFGFSPSKYREWADFVLAFKAADFKPKAERVALF